MWKREDYTGTKEVVWYSEEEYKGIEKELAKFLSARVSVVIGHCKYALEVKATNPNLCWEVWLKSIFIIIFTGIILLVFSFDILHKP